MSFLTSFWWPWEFLLKNLKFKDKLQIWGFDWFIFCLKFVFFGLFYGVLVSIILKFFVSVNHWWPTFLFSLLHYERASYGTAGIRSSVLGGQLKEFLTVLLLCSSISLWINLAAYKFFNEEPAWQLSFCLIRWPHHLQWQQKVSQMIIAWVQSLNKQKQPQEMFC